KMRSTRLPKGRGYSVDFPVRWLGSVAQCPNRYKTVIGERVREKDQVPFNDSLMIQKQSFNRRSFLKTIGAAALGAPFLTRGLMAQSPNGVVRHASFGAAGMAWSDVTEFSKFPQFKLVAVAEVDLNRTAELKKKFPDVTVYQDWRKLLDKEAKNIDSVNV